jgi:hypothetical protein
MNECDASCCLYLSPFPEIWDYFQGTLLKKYSQQYGGINVVTGPAFDYNYDGRFDSQDQIQEYVSMSTTPLLLGCLWRSVDPL